MDPITYSIVLLFVFIAGVLAFTYLETPRRTLDKGIKTLNKGVKKVKIHVLNINKDADKSFSVTAEKKADKGDDMRVYIHEY